MRAHVPLILAAFAFGLDGGCSSTSHVNDAGASGSAGAEVGGSGGAGGGGGAATCADLAARAAALLVKDCTSSDQCAVTTVYNCCTVYTGIRADAKAAYESAQAAHDRACPDLRGCLCQDHTETNELVPIQQPPLPVSATCDVGKCTAHKGGGGAAGTGGSDAGAAMSYACGSDTCVPGQTLCYSYVGGLSTSTRSFSCMTVPAACAKNPTCACLCPPIPPPASDCTYVGATASGSCGCSDDNNQLTISCAGS